MVKATKVETPHGDIFIAKCPYCGHEKRFKAVFHVALCPKCKRLFRVEVEV